MAESLTPSELKIILHSKHSNIYYLQYCRILVNGGRVEYITEEGKQSLYWNIPIANTKVVMLGTGTLVTQAAVRGEEEMEFRQRCLSNFQLADALDVMIDSLQDIAQQLSKVSK